MKDNEKREPIEILEKVYNLLKQEKLHYESMHDKAKIISESTGLKKDALIRLKDLLYGKGVGWDDDPMVQTYSDRYPDKIAPMFRRLYQLIDDFNSVGMLCELEPYLNSLKERGISIEIKIPESKLNDEEKQRVKDALNFMIDRQYEIYNITDTIKDNSYDKMLEDTGFIPKSGFKTAVNFYIKKEKENKDILEKVNDIVVDNKGINKGLTNIIEGNYFTIINN